jgi:hypothetical protein
VICYHYDKGEINGASVAGLTLALVAHVPGNILKGNWKVAAHVDSKATPQQKEAILAAHTGKLGGPLAELSPLIGEVVGVYDVPIEFNITEGRGTLRIGDTVSAEMQPYTDAQGRPTKLVDSIFSTIPGSPAYVGKAMNFKINMPKLGMKLEFNGRNAVLGNFRFEA